MISGGFGAPDAAASALTIRVIAARTRVRTSSSNVRTFSFMTASSGMTFSLSPACSDPTVTTAASEAASSRDTMVCSRSTVAAAITTGSIAGLRHRPVRASPEHPDLQAVGGGRDHARRDCRPTRRAQPSHAAQERRPASGNG